MSVRNYIFREAGRHDFQNIEELFITRGVKRGWTTWKYLDCPDGFARVFVAKDPANSVVGTLVHLPRRFTSADTGTITVMQVVDVFVSAKLRTHGVFLGLLDFANNHIDGSRIGVPNESSEGFGLGLGWHTLAPYETWQFPVKVGSIFTGSGLAFIAPVFNTISRIYEYCWLPRSTRNFKMKRITRYQKDYTLDPAVIHGVRSANYLNWRFVDNPNSTYYSFEFFEADESIGYCVFTRVGSSAFLYDFVTTRNQRNCLKLVVDYCRKQSIGIINFGGTGLQIRKLGFIHRQPDRNCNAIEVPEGRWLITACDLDFEHPYAESDCH